MANRALSKRSMRPPCPGMRLPESLTPVERFQRDSNKSPNTPVTCIRADTIRQCQMGKVKSPVQFRMAPASMAMSMPPMKPAQDFLGEMVGHILAGQSFWPKSMPKQYAPTSEAQIMQKKATMRIPLYSPETLTTALERARGRPI